MMLRMQKMEANATTAKSRRSPLLWFGGLFLVLLGVAGWVMFMIASGETRPSITLPNGVIVTYHSSSTGTPTVTRFHGAGFEHEDLVPVDRFQRLWKDVYDRLPKAIASRLPAPKPPEYFPKGPGTDPLELRLRVESGFRAEEWDIGVADEDSWETKAPNYIAPRGSKWIRLGSAFPRSSKMLHIRFHPSEQKDRDLSPEARGSEFTELTIKNPFYQGPITAKGGAPPISKPFRGGTITLTRFARESTVGNGYGMLHTEFTLERGGRPLLGYDWEFDVSDSSRQVFRQPVRLRDSLEDGILTVRAFTAPWNDDPSWTLRLSLCRSRGSADIKDDEVFRFDNLPVPSPKTAIKLNRSVTKNGITLTIAGITISQSRQAYFTVTGWTQGDPLRRIVIKDARDNQGRTEVEGAFGSKASIVGASTDYGPKGPTFSVILPPDAKSWEVSLVPETITLLDFTVQPPPVK